MWKRHTRMISNLYVQHHWLATQKNWRQSIYQKISWLYCIMKHCKQRWRHQSTAAHFSESSKIQVFSNDCTQPQIRTFFRPPESNTYICIEWVTINLNLASKLFHYVTVLCNDVINISQCWPGIIDVYGVLGHSFNVKILWKVFDLNIKCLRLRYCAMYV